MKAKNNNKKKIKKQYSKAIYLIRSITKNSDDYDKTYMKIKLESDDDLPLNKRIEFHNVAIAIFYKNKQCYPQAFLDEYL